MRYHFRGHVLDIRSGTVTGPDGELVLRRQAWSLLRELVERAPELIERDELLDRVWGRQALSPNVLPQTISEIRQALGDSARHPRYVETVHGRGYRMICPVEIEQQADDSSADDASDNATGEAAPELREPRGWPMAALLMSITDLSLLLWALWGWLGPGSGSGVSAVSSQAVDHSASERLRRQAERARAGHDILAAAAHWRALAAMEPESIDVLLELTRAELDALQGARARATLSRIEDLLAGRDYPRFELLSAEMLLLDGELDRASTRLEALLSQAAERDDADLAVRSALLLTEHARQSGDVEAGRERLQAMAVSDRWALDRDQRARLLLEAVRLALGEGRIGLTEELIESLKALEPNQTLRHHLAIQQALLETRKGRPEQALQTLDLLAGAPNRPRDPPFEIALHNALGRAAVDAEQIARAREHFDQAHALALEHGHALKSAQLQVNGGLALARRNRMEEADALWLRALEIFQAVGDRRGEATCLGNLAASASSRGLNERSREFNEQALALFRSLNLGADRARTAFNLALLASRAGRLDDAERLLSEAETVYRSKQDHELTLHVGTFRAELRTLAGDLIQAGQLLADLEAGLERGSFTRRAALHRAAGHLALAGGDLDAARERFDQALELHRRGASEDWIRASETARLKIDFLAGEDPWPIHVQAAERAADAERAGQARDAARAWLLAAEAQLGSADASRANRLIERAAAQLELFEDAAVSFELDWVRAWAAEEAERSARLDALAERAARMGYGLFQKRVEDSRKAMIPGAVRSAASGPVLPPYVTPAG